jgi:hypothetical protein
VFASFRVGPFPLRVRGLDDGLALRSRNIAALTSWYLFPFLIGTQPKRITEVDGIAVGEAIEIESPRQPNRIFLGISPDRRISVRPRASKLKPLLFLAASRRSFLIVKATPKPGRVF